MNSVSTRKLIGTIILLVFLALYACVMFVVGTAMAANTSSQLAAWAFYVLAGFGWVLPAGWIIRWMVKPLKADDHRHIA